MTDLDALANRRGVPRRSRTKHKIERISSGHFEDAFKNIDDKSHWSLVIVQQQYTIKIRFRLVGEGRALVRAVVDADLEGIVAKHLADADGHDNLRDSLLRSPTRASIALRCLSGA